jgi:hypothetical protein
MAEAGYTQKFTYSMVELSCGVVLLRSNGVKVEYMVLETALSSDLGGGWEVLITLTGRQTPITAELLDHMMTNVGISGGA